jgi:mitochondrial fission protein ELM1
MSVPVWYLHDGKIGLKNQALGVAEAVGLPFAEKNLAIRLPWRVLPPSLWLNALSAAGPGGDKLLPPWPRLVIGAGNRAAAPMLAIREAAGGRCLVVQVQTPALSARHFDLMIVPAHDRIRGDNVLVSLGAVHRVTPTRLAEAAAFWAPKLDFLPRPRVAVLLGGGNGSYRLSEARAGSIAADLQHLARGGAGLMITPSRRTGAAAEAIIREALDGLPAIIWDGTGDNPYFGFLALADHILATADSVSMITEASATGRPVQVIPLDGGSAKFDRFHRSLATAGVTRVFQGGLEHWTYPARDDTGEAGARIRRMMQERGLWAE